MTAHLDQAFADALEDAQVLRKRGHGHDAELIEQLVADFRKAAGLHLAWLSEGDAVLRSGKKLAWLRKRRRGWAVQGFARRRPDGRWEYLACVVPQQLDVRTLEDDARAAARQERKAS